MRQVFLKRVVLTEPAVAGHFIYDQVVDAGKILVLRNLAGHWSGILNTESIIFLVNDGFNLMFLGEDLPDTLSGCAYWTGCVAIGEGDRVGFYAANSAANDVLTLDICGELWDIADWKKG